MKPEFVGEGKGKYRTVNVAWETNMVVDEAHPADNKPSHCGNNEYKHACDSLLFPMVQEFNPDIILISCGFDCAIHDPLGWCNVSPMMFAYMTHGLNKICPRLLVIQEGGYNTDFLG